LVSPKRDGFGAGHSKLKDKIYKKELLCKKRQLGGGQHRDRVLVKKASVLQSEMTDTGIAENPAGSRRAPKCVRRSKTLRENLRSRVRNGRRQTHGDERPKGFEERTESDRLSPWEQATFLPR